MSSSSSLGSRTLQEIQTQPANWARGVEVAAAERLAALPQAGERVLALGCGTSYYIAQAYAALRERSDDGETDALVASELPERWRQYDRVIAISRSGKSAEVVDALQHLAGDIRVTAIVGVPDSPVANLADQVIDLSFADEDSVVQTRFATTALATLRAGLGDDLGSAINDARSALGAQLPQVPKRQLVVLASGWAASLAQEAALKCREAAAAWVEAYPSGEYRHGPIAVADSETLVWALTPLSAKQTEAIVATGAAIEQGQLDPMAELIRLQRFAVEWAAQRGRDADRPTNLTRAVTDV